MSSYKKIAYSAPSNIAFVKYWGKHGRQLPINPSISMTLDNCRSLFEVEYSLCEDEKGILEFLFENKPSSKFQQRLQKYLDSIEDIYPLAPKLSLKIKTSNTFAHSAGIASSASAMAAFCSCLTYIEAQIKGVSETSFEQLASSLSRLASGSACRSLQGPFVQWGRDQKNEGTDNFGIKCLDYHRVFENLQDTILVVSSAEKTVSSSAGHALMEKHPYKDARIIQAHKNLIDIKQAMKSGNLERFGEILELEALSLHGLMMSSSPSYMLLEADSVKVIERVRLFRKETKKPLYFTIDAGPNIHLIYPDAIKEDVKTFINESLGKLCEKIIYDQMGYGVIKIES